MTRRTWIVFVLLASVLGGGGGGRGFAFECQSKSEVPPMRARVQVEFRLAETEPGTGLVEWVGKSGEKYYLHKEVLITNDDILSAGISRSHDSVETWEIHLKFTTQAGERMAAASAQHIGRPMAFLVNGEVVSVAMVLMELRGEGQITGRFSKAEVEDIASSFNSK